MKKTKIKKLLAILSPDNSLSEGFSAFDEGAKKLKRDLEEKVKSKTLDDVNSTLDKFRSRISLDPLVESVDKIRTGFTEAVETLFTEAEQKHKEILDLMSKNKGEFDSKISDAQEELADIVDSISAVVRTKNNELDALRKDIEDIQTAHTSLEVLITKTQENIETLKKSSGGDKRELSSRIELADANIEKLRQDILSRLSNLGGGNMNRQIKFNSVDYLTKYTDINWKAGNNVTFTIANNDTTKMVDITVASSGSGGGGITRVITSVAVNTVAGAAADTDYVYLVSGTTTITLPTAVANDNLYTIKNVGSGTVTVDTTGGETIDDGATVSLPVQYTSVDLISDGTNWKVT